MDPIIPVEPLGKEVFLWIVILVVLAFLSGWTLAVSRGIRAFRYVGVLLFMAALEFMFEFAFGFGSFQLFLHALWGDAVTVFVIWWIDEREWFLNRQEREALALKKYHQEIVSATPREPQRPRRFR